MERIPVCASEELPERGARKFVVQRGGRSVEAFAVRVEGIARAYLNVCTHRAIELDLGRGSFFDEGGGLLRCRAHGALFRPDDGACAGGICPKPGALTRVELLEVDGWVFALEP